MAKSNKYLKIYNYQYVSFFYDISQFIGILSNDFFISGNGKKRKQV